MLKGAKYLLEKLIDLRFLEWTGDLATCEYFWSCGYVIYDSLYMAVPKVEIFDPFRELGFELVSIGNLSTGRHAFDMKLISGDPLEVMK